MGYREVNIVDLLKRELEPKVKEAVKERLIKQYMEEFEKELRPRIEEVVEEVTVTGIENLHDTMTMSQHLHVFLQWKDKKSGVVRTTARKVG